MVSKTTTATLACLIFLVGCTGQFNQNTPAENAPEATCAPTDQDQYVWNPVRLQFLQTCIRVVGTVREVSSAEADGDTHVHVELDPPYQSLLTPGNEEVEGLLVVEAVCQFVPPLIEALRVCASDPDPYSDPFPQVGDHIWVEGRYVLDLWHNSHAELHPLYRWGISP